MFSSVPLSLNAYTLLQDWGVIGNVAAPIIIRNEVYGILTVGFDHHRGITDEDINLIQSLADSAAVAINNAQFIDETQQEPGKTPRKPTAPRASSWPT